MRAVMYGGGNIGRGFISLLFRQAGYAVTVIDVAQPVVQGLNARGIVPNLVAGIRRRFKMTDRPPNIIICENLLDAGRRKRWPLSRFSAPLCGIMRKKHRRKAMATIALRTASGPEDAALLTALAREIWTQHYTELIGKAQVAYMLDTFQSREAIVADIANGYVYTLAYWEGEPCGYSAIRFDADALFLSKLYVRESCRGQGIAREMMRAAEEAAQRHGLKTIRLTCNKGNAGSLAAYAQMGFKHVDSVATDIGGGFVMDDHLMEKRL